MKRVLIVIAMLLCLATSAYAGCYTTKDSIMYFSPERFMAVDQVIGISQEQGVAMMKQDIVDGNAVYVKAGIKIDDVQKFNNYISVVRIGHQVLVALNDFISCK